MRWVHWNRAWLVGGIWSVIASGLLGGGPPAPKPIESDAVVIREEEPGEVGGVVAHEERPADPWMPRSGEIPPGVQVRCEPVVLGPYKSVQVNVDEFGCNIPGDAANEPSIAIDPTNPRRIVIGWRQFDAIGSDFRQAGYGYSHDGGHTWVFPGVLRPGVFGSDPVLDADSHGRFYYHTIRCGELGCGDLFKSVDRGLTWQGPNATLLSDKPWMVVDRTGGMGDGHIYAAASTQFVRSVDHGGSFSTVGTAEAGLGLSSMAIGAEGEVFVSIYGVSYDAQDGTVAPTFQQLPGVSLGAAIYLCGNCPNYVGLHGQLWVSCDQSDGAFRGAVYALASVRPTGMTGQITQVLFARSLDGGYHWSTPIRINNDENWQTTWHWFGTLSVAPNGRLDVIWNDTRNTGQLNLSELFYAFSTDGGVTWTGNHPISPVFDSHVGWPHFLQQKLGDYYHMISDNLGVNIAYAATFNGEQDVYFLRIGPYDCNGNEIPDENDIADGTSFDCNENEVPDECEYRGDFNGDGLTALDDHFAYTQCRTAPGVEYSTPCCGLFDIDPDGDADLADFAFVQRAFAVLGP